MKQYEAVIQTLENLGGIATLGQLNQEVFKLKECEWKTKTPFASIRRIVQLNKEIYKIKPGLYGLVKYKSINESNGFITENEKNKNSEEVNNFNHTYYQGLLLNIGNLKGYSTFIPNQDKNKIFFNKTLDEIKTLTEIPAFSYKEFVNRAATIDVIWFNNQKMPHSLFEVEYSTDIQNSLLKFNDLQDFHTRMVIVADSIRKNEYLKKIKYSAFKDLEQENRVSFLSYEDLVKQYEKTIESLSYNFIL
ncbi:hypothetical protein [Fusobacterium sp.]|uniref:hypothetical protein n=1 Tax=Fusobacterium sp. TaxID=68766 RepID=UPI001F4FCA7C|nr:MULTISPECIES: hypothetical protein [Fusobacterium]MCI5725308.1 hypothetical protein [Fusobacterium sp.]MCI7222852.1 hypothetical protein [Fusobacterium sp.]